MRVGAMLAGGEEVSLVGAAGGDSVGVVGLAALICRSLARERISATSARAVAEGLAGFTLTALRGTGA